MGANVAMSVQQFAELPPDERVRYELVEGEAVLVSSSRPKNARAASRLNAWLETQASAVGVVVGETDCRTSEDTIRRPDLSFFVRERWRRFDLETLLLPSSPDIAIEILSPSEAMPTVRRKVREYLASGSSEVWTVDLDNQEIFIWTATASKLLGPDDFLETPVIPGLRIPASQILTVE
jgi:Uma2 family endonuclease